MTALALLVRRDRSRRLRSPNAPGAPRPAERAPDAAAPDQPADRVRREIRARRKRIGGARPARDPLPRAADIGRPMPRSLRGAKLLLAAHPNAQPAENLVALDKWVRGGGRLLLLADPMLEWHSERPLGDPLRPPPGFADTGLLRALGAAARRAGRRAGRSSGPWPGNAFCSPRRAGWSGAARSRPTGWSRAAPIGKGRVTIIADADFLDERGVEGAPSSRQPRLAGRRAGDSGDSSESRNSQSFPQLESQEQV